MKERNSLIDLIKSLNADELAGLRHFICAPLLPGRPAGDDPFRLLNIILDAAPNFPDELVGKKYLHHTLFGGTPWVEGRLKKVMIVLRKQIQDYLLIRHYFREDNQSQRELDLYQVFQGKNLKHRQEHLMQKSIKALEQLKIKDGDYYLHHFRLHYTWSQYALADNQTRRDLKINRLLQDLAGFYHLRRLDLLNFSLTQQKLTTATPGQMMKPLLLEEEPPAECLAESRDLFIQKTLLDLQMLKNPTTQAFRDLTSLLKESRLIISDSLLQNAYTILRNLCRSMIYTGQTEYLHVLHELHRDNLEQGLLYHKASEQKIQSNTFLNIVNVALLTKQFDWVRDFLHTHRHMILGDNEQEDFYHLNEAAYLFATGRYEAALDILPPVFPNISYQLIARRLEIKIYYELRSRLLEFKLDAFKMYISRASRKFLSVELRERNADFANLLTQIIQSVPGDKKRKEQLLHRIEERVWAAERDWLSEKVEQMP